MPFQISGKQLVEADTDRLAFRLQLKGITISRYSWYVKISSAYAGNSGVDGEGFVTRGLAEFNKITPVALACVLKSDIPILKSEVTSHQPVPRPGFFIALHEIQIKNAVSSLISDPRILTEASIIIEEVSCTDIHHALWLDELLEFVIFVRGPNQAREDKRSSKSHP